MDQPIPDPKNQAGDAQSRALHVRSFAKDLEFLKGDKKQNMQFTTAAPTPAVLPPAQPPKPVEEKKPVPVPPPAPKAPEPPPPPVQPSAPPPPAPELPKDTAKEDLLARLRAKVSALHEKENAPAVPVPPAPQAPTEPAPPIPLTKTPAAGAPIHTYKSDFAEYIDKKSANVFSVLAAEKDSTEVPAEVLKKKDKPNVAFIIGGMLILLGIVGTYAAYRWSHDLSLIPTQQAVPSLVFADDKKELAGTGDELLSQLAAAAEQPLPSGNVLITYVSTATTDDKGAIVRFPAAGGVLIRDLELPAPEILLRNVLDESTVGIIHAGEDTRAFFIFRVSSFERTFAGMLEWERKIGTDLAPLYPLYQDPVQEVGTSTPPAASPAPAFVDDVVANHDVRALRDHKNRTILIYGYRDKETLIIARDENAFAQLVERLAATRE